VGVAVFCSRILGLAREQVFAALFGAGLEMDAFVVAYRIPNLLRDLFAEGALSAAFVTVFTSYEQTDTKENTLKLVNNVILSISIVIAAITFIAYIFSKDLVWLIAPHFKDIAGKAELTTTLARIMLPFLLFVSLASITQGFLNTKKYFFIPAFSSSMFNLGSIVVGGGLAILLPVLGYPAIVGMAVGTLAGGLFQLLVQLPLAIKAGYRFNLTINFNDPGLKKIFMLIIPSIIGLSATQITIFVNTGFASGCGDGAVAWLNYAFRLIFFPIGMFGVAISIAALPVISNYAAKKDIPGLKDSLESALSLVFLLTFPATIGLIILSEPIIKIIYEYGKFSSFDTMMTARLLELYSIGLIAYCGVKIIVPVFYALNDTKWPVIGSFGGVVLNIIIILLFVKYYNQNAIAIATSCTMIFNFIFLFIVLTKKLGMLNFKKILTSASKTIISSGLMGILCYLLHFKLLKFEGRSGLIFSLLLTIGFSSIFYIFICYVTGQNEIKMLIGKIKSRFGW
jgi:putative peptidoglycan lipid II flippase